jgi:D-alanyl-D-alanine carboxypeptidase
MNLKRAIGGPLLSIVFLVFFVYMIAGVSWFFDNYSQSQEVFLGSASDSVQNIEQQYTIEDIVLPVSMETGVLEVSAEAAISVESNLNGINIILFEKAGDKKLPIASLTKLMTAIVVLDNYNLSDTIVVSETADAQDPMKQDVKLGDIFPVKSLFDIMLIGSSNKSAYALSEKMGKPVFVGLMNKKAKDLGLKSTFFVDPTGLSPEDVSTARDLIKLTEHILKNYPQIADISKLKELEVPDFGRITNTDQLLGEVPDIICSKTGFTEAAKGCLLLVVRPKGHPLKNNDYIINVVLGADDRFSEMEKLINWCN